jgi:transcriptional regulator with XRE-family HTH domain
MKLCNITVGQNISKYRKIKDMKAAVAATQVGLKESSYTKYERGETAITVEFLQKIADILDVDPIKLLAADPSRFLETIQVPAAMPQKNEPSGDVMYLMQKVIQINERMLTAFGNNYPLAVNA